MGHEQHYELTRSIGWTHHNWNGYARTIRATHFSCFKRIHLLIVAIDGTQSRWGFQQFKEKHSNIDWEQCQLQPIQKCHVLQSNQWQKLGALWGWVRSSILMGTTNRIFGLECIEKCTKTRGSQNSLCT